MKVQIEVKRLHVWCEQKKFLGFGCEVIATVVVSKGIPSRTSATAGPADFQASNRSRKRAALLHRQEIETHTSQVARR